MKSYSLLSEIPIFSAFLLNSKKNLANLMTPTLDADSTGPITCKYVGLLCLQWIFWIRPWPDLDPDLTGLNGPQIRIQRAGKHVNILVYFVCNGFSGFDLGLTLTLT